MAMNARTTVKILCCAAAAAFLITAADILLCLVYPDVPALRKNHPDKSAFMEHREKEWARQGKEKEIRHSWVPFRKMSPYLVKAVIISEDDKFWDHEGFDFEAMQIALQEDIRERKFKAGGSTISQQLAKNLYLSPSKNPVRKAKEAILTWRLEKALSKKRIMELYLNYAEWGDGIFGIGAAARHYYRKPPSGLSAREASRLASVLPSPRKHKPTGGSKYVQYRSGRIYRIMVQRGIVIPEYREIMNAPEEKTEDMRSDILAAVADTAGLDLTAVADTNGLRGSPDEPPLILAVESDTSGPQATVEETPGDRTADPDMESAAPAREEAALPVPASPDGRQGDVPAP